LTHPQRGEVGRLSRRATIRAKAVWYNRRDHLARFPGGVTERYVRERLEAAAWAGLASNTGLDDLNGYLVEFPDGAHAPEAQRRIAELERQALAVRELEERQRRETEAWALASAAGDAATLRSFLNDWPKSPHAKAARSRIKELAGVPARRWLWQGAGVAGVACLAALFWEVQSYNQPKGPVQATLPLTPLPGYDEKINFRSAPEPPAPVAGYAYNHGVITGLGGNAYFESKKAGASIAECQRMCASQTRCVAVEFSRIYRTCQLYKEAVELYRTTSFDTWRR
jgi:hypothetical protein